MAIVVNKNNCPQNHKCPAVKVCPVHALVQDGFDAPVVNSKTCVECGMCVKTCPMEALRMK